LWDALASAEGGIRRGFGLPREWGGASEPPNDQGENDGPWLMHHRQAWPERPIPWAGGRWR